MMDQKGMVPWRPASSQFYELTPKQRREEDLLHPFYEEQMRQEHARRVHEIKNLEAACQMRDHRRNLIHEVFQTQVKRRRIKELYEVSTHAALLVSWDTLEKQDFATKADVTQKMRREHHFAMDIDCHDFEDEVAVFESKGYELGADTSIDLALELKNKDKGKEKQKDTSKVSKDEKLTKKLKPVESSESTQDGSKVLLEIKERVSKVEKEKFETEQKRRMDEYETKQREREIEEITKKKDEEEKLKKFQEDQALQTEELQAAEHLEKENHALRLELEQQLAEQRNREWEAVLARDHEVLLMMKHDRDNEVNFEQRLWQEERQRKVEQRHLKHRNLCLEVLLQIINLAESSAMYKESTNCAPSAVEWWEWKNLFVRGAIQPINLSIESLEADTLLLKDEEVAEELQATVMDYVNEQGEWKFLHPIGTNKELGNIIFSLFHKRDLDPCPMPPPYLSSMQLKLAVVGSPFSGKTFVAKLLEDQFGIVRLEIDKIVASAIADATHNEEISDSHHQSNEQGASEVPPLEQRSSRETHASEGTTTSTISPRIALGQQAREAVANGLQVPDEVTVQLLLHVLESLDHCVFRELETPSLSPKDIKKKENSLRVKGNTEIHSSSQASSTPPASQKKAGKERGAVSKDGCIVKKKITGFILDGFPSTQHQAEILQRGLSGLKLVLESKSPEFISLLAPLPDFESSAVRPSYPLDALFLLEPLEEGDALNLAMGKYVDPKTGLFYHLEFHPPPENDRTGIVSRLEPIEDVSAAGKRIKDGMLMWNVLFEWINTFSNACLVHRDERKRISLDETYKTVQGLLDAKLKIPAAADAAKAAVEAEEAAIRAAYEAENASSQAKAIAQKLFLSKFAEVEALTMLERSNNDPAAKDILKKKVSESTSRLLQEATKAVKEAEASAETAKKAGDDACKASQVADEAASSVSAVMQAREEALAAAESAKLSALKSASAYQRAQLAADNALSNLTDTTNSVDNSDKSFLKQKILDLSAQPTEGKVETPSMLESNNHASEADQGCAEFNCHKSLTSWTQQRTEAVSQYFSLLIQIERERFLQTCCLLYEYFLNKSSSVIKDKFADGVSLPSPRSKQIKNLPPLPGWLPSVASALPHLHQVLEQTIISINAIAKATLEVQSVNPNQLSVGHKTPLKGSKGTSEANAVKEILNDGKLDHMAKIVLDETQLLLLRFERLASKAYNQLSDLEELLEGAKKQIKKWIEDSRKVKNETTDEVISIVQEAIEESIPLWYYMCLDGDRLAIVETNLQLDPPRPTGLQPLPDLSCCHYQVLEELVKTFLEGNLKGYVSMLQVIEAVQHAVEVVHTLCKNDVTLSMIPRVPGSKSRPGGPFQVWKDYTQTLVKISPENLVQVIDWRCFLISLVNAHFHNFICGASVEDIAKAHIAMKDAADEGSSFLQLPQFLGTKLWFDTDNGYICGERMKEILYSMLSFNSGLPWRILLLYLCKDSEVELALKKAHAAITGTLLEDVTLTPQELTSALYPCGPEGASDQGCQIWSSQEIKNLLHGQSEQEAEIRENVRGTDESDDNRTGSNTFVRSTGACRGSKLSEQSLISFELMASEQQSNSEKGGGITTSISSEAISRVDNYDRGASSICNSQKRSSSIDRAKKRASNIDNKQIRMSKIDCNEIRASKMDDNEMRTSNADGEVKIDSTCGKKQGERQQEADDDDDSAGSQLEVCSLFSEKAVATMNEFLAACDEALHRSPRTDEGGAPSPHESVEDNDIVFSLPDLLASELSSVLQARFCTDSLLVMKRASESSS
ncbi:hypothetical protein GOP47_0003846 [Adiantum capillus-veneris]|uniref:CPC1/SPEF2 domain-containing protein n=1 Tax=Adiantum capillus-veneris TaxID=13818 RepID=A0A9D4ZM16_ADICA|nr:hypothetical protein GOP47_0003846 [Adiantum capillus-veneris]